MILVIYYLNDALYIFTAPCVIEFPELILTDIEVNKLVDDITFTLYILDRNGKIVTKLESGNLLQSQIKVDSLYKKVNSYT